MTKEYLEDYYLLDKSIKRCEKKLKYYLEHPLNTINGTVMSSMKEFPYCLTHVTISAADNPKNEEKRNEIIRSLVNQIAENMQEYEEKRVFIDLFIESIEDLEMKEIINMRYIDKMTFQQIGDELGYDLSSIHKKIDAYFQRFQNPSVINS